MTNCVVNCIVSSISWRNSNHVQCLNYFRFFSLSITNIKRRPSIIKIKSNWMSFLCADILNILEKSIQSYYLSSSSTSNFTLRSISVNAFNVSRFREPVGPIFLRQSSPSSGQFPLIDIKYQLSHVATAPRNIQTIKSDLNELRESDRYMRSLTAHKEHFYKAEFFTDTFYQR
jgi:hypothetical protein